MSDKKKTKKQWLAIRKQAGLQIDPETAEVFWTYAHDFDPYGVNPNLPEEWNQIGRVRFARSPGSDIWVEFGDLPDATRDALYKKLDPRQEDEAEDSTKRRPRRARNIRF